jgi:outer membrane biosynthesis protein TonB
MAHPTPLPPYLPRAAVPWRSLLALVALVLVVHLLVLSASNTPWSLAQSPNATSSMRTRALDAAPAPAIAPAPAAAPPPAAPPVPPKPPAQPKVVKKVPPAQQNIAQVASKNIAPMEPPTLQPEPPPTRVASEEATPPGPAPESTPTVTATASANDKPPSDTSLEANDPSKAAANPGRELPLQFPESGKFGYNVTVLRGAQPQTGSGTLEWTTDGSQYQLRLEATAFFLPLLSQTSVGSLTADGLQPERFSDKRFNRSEKATHFQHDKGRITFSGSQNEAPLLRGAQDQLSVLMQLAGMFAGSPKQLSEQGRVSVQVASTEDAETWLFTVDGEEKLVLPAGQTRTLRLVRNPRKEFDTRLEVWLAPSLGYLPVRIKQTNTNNGNSEDLQLRSPAFR